MTTLTMLGLTASLLLQPPGQTLEDLLRANLRADMAELIGDSMELTEGEEETFWPIYRHYERDRRALGDRRMALLEEFAASQETMTNDKASAFTQRSFALEEDTLKLRRSYYAQMSKALSATIATRFMQVERQITGLIDVQIASQVPLIKIEREAAK